MKIALPAESDEKTAGSVGIVFISSIRIFIHSLTVTPYMSKRLSLDPLVVL